MLRGQKIYDFFRGLLAWVWTVTRTLRKGCRLKRKGRMRPGQLPPARGGFRADLNSGRCHPLLVASKLEA